MGSTDGPWQRFLLARVPWDEGARREQVLATSRLLISLICLSAICIDGSWRGVYGVVGRLIPLLYVLHSLVILATLFLVRRVPRLWANFIHAADLVWPFLICLFTAPFFFLFAFAVVAAAYRWKPRATVVTAVASAGIILLEALLLSSSAASRWGPLGEPLALGGLMVRTMGLLILGGLLAYLFDRKRVEDAGGVADFMLQRVHPQAGIRENLKELLPVLLETFAAKRIALVLRDSSSGRVFELSLQADGARSGLLQRRQIRPLNAGRYLFPMPATSWLVSQPRGNEGCGLLTLDREGRLEKTSRPVSPDRVWDEPFRSLCAVDVRFGNEWTGRVFLADADCPGAAEARLRLFQRLILEVAPAVYQSYLWWRIRARVRSNERERIARDLHDGVIQALIAMEMNIESLRRQNAQSTFRVSDPLREVQSLIRGEVRNLRRLIEQLRADSPPHALRPCLAEMIAKFERETGITASFSCDAKGGVLPRRVAHEVEHIVQEALSNVRKHSGARTVDIRLSLRQGTWQVVIQDDGRGFDFCGRLSDAQLDAAQKGPRVIRERVHCVNGDLAIESYPDRGARLEIRLASNG